MAVTSGARSVARTVQGVPTVHALPGDGTRIVEAEVRELVRRGDVDPATDPEATALLVEDAVADYERRAAIGSVPALADVRSTARAVLDAVAGFGPLQAYLDDPAVEEIWINSPATVFVARDGVPELTTTILTEATVRDLVERMLRSSGRRLDLSSPFVDATLPGGERLHVVIPDITRRHFAVNIRKHVARTSRIDDLVRMGSLPAPAARFLDAAVRAGLNVLVSGATQAGKTTMLNALAGSIPGQERVITCEEVFELRFESRDLVAMQCRQPSLEGTGEVPLRRLVKEALRMRPDRIVIGEVREAESLDLLVALNAGVPGLCTIHASSGREALVKLCTLPLLAGPNISDRFVVPTVAAAVDVVVHLGIDAHGVRRVREVLGVSGRVEAGVVEASELFTTRDGRLVRASGYPPGEERFARAGIDVAAILRAADHDEALGTGVR
ncbi:CpaF family protein [Cellulomonas sp. PhB143]|uniref:CpaF family protein n=1 Tax=Cellulomonas sp. PhB143 TaxID=2485186 RepID=UPI000F4722B2|nr:ATPase, T2SS/T4P/T4SS family [Cellulomonas sp. PhB143]ROS76984.1 pilus assembly protein CpaF [Cellulomonas sp. PhB143]